MKVQEQLVIGGPQWRQNMVNEPDFIYKQSENLSHIDPGNYLGREELSPEINLSNYF